MSTGYKGNLAIIGQGYVGLPLAMASAKSGWTVIGIDNNPKRIKELNAGMSPIEDVDSSELISLINADLYSVTDDYSFVSEAHIVVICVPTPLNENREPDLTLLDSAVKSLAPFLKEGTLIINESTSYPGTLRNFLIPLIRKHAPKSIDKLYFASAPERVNPGDLIWKQKNTPRLVGGIDAESLSRALDFYQTICDVVKIVDTPEIAEAAKLLENTFRLVNIALINEFTQLCAKSDIDIYGVIEAASTKPYGFMPFFPGVGVGGHCIPVDPLYLTWWARQNNVKAEVVELADSVNISMPAYVADRALSMVKSNTSTPRVLILGVAYKAGLADVRETPVEALFNNLLTKGTNVAWHDPLVANWRGESIKIEDWEGDVAILAVNQPGMDIEILVKKGIPILDCTGSKRQMDMVTTL